MSNPLSRIVECVLVATGLAVRRDDPDPRYDMAPVVEALQSSLKQTRLLISSGAVPEVPWLDAALPRDCVHRCVSATTGPRMGEAGSKEAYALNLHIGDALAVMESSPAARLNLVVLHATFAEINSEPERWLRTLGCAVELGLDAVRFLGGTREGMWQPVLPADSVVVLMYRTALRNPVTLSGPVRHAAAR